MVQITTHFRPQNYSLSDASSHPPVAMASAHDSAKSVAASPYSTSDSRLKRRRYVDNPRECCRTCRLRKVKCSGNPGNGRCTNCTRLDLVCTFVPGRGDSAEVQEHVSRTVPSRSHTEAGTVRKRAQRACRECHTHKTKCSGDLPRCKRCQTSGLACEYTPAKRRFATVPSMEKEAESEITVMLPDSTCSGATKVRPTTAIAVSPSVDALSTDYLIAENLLFRKDFILNHVNAYFQFLYPVPGMNFLHPATTYQQIEEDQFPPILSTAICALTVMLVNPGESGVAFATYCNEQVEFFLFRNLGRLELENLKLFVLTVVYNLAGGQWGKSWMLHSLASRLMKSLQIDSGTRGSPVEQESSRRLGWTVFILDKYMAGGCDDHLELPQSRMHLELPCTDEALQEDRPTQMKTLHMNFSMSPPDTSPPIFALLCKCMALRHNILSTTKTFTVASSSSKRQHIEASQVVEDMLALQIRVTNLEESIPDTFNRSEASIRKYVDGPDWAGLVVVHTWLCQLHMDLYRWSLPGVGEQAGSELIPQLPVDLVQRCQGQAVGWAVSLSEFWTSVQKCLKGRPRGHGRLLSADLCMGICAVQSTKILLIARKYGLYSHFQTHTTAPLRCRGIVDERVHQAMINSNLTALEDLSFARTTAGQLFRELKAVIAQYDNIATQTHTDQVATGPVPEQLRYTQGFMEGALEYTNVNLAAGRGRTPALADQWFAESTQPAIDPSRFITTTQVDYTPQTPTHRPHMPFFLSQARGFGDASGSSDSGADPGLFAGISTASPCDYELLSPGVFASGLEHHPSVIPELPPTVCTDMSFPVVSEPSLFENPYVDPALTGSTQYYHIPHRGAYRE